jgi:hypothetical protein
MIRYSLALVIALARERGPVLAGKFNAKLNIGDSAPMWTALPGGRQESLAQRSQGQGCNCRRLHLQRSAPVSRVYEDRLIEFTAKYAGADKKVAFVAISCGREKGDGLPEMKERAKEKGFNFPYLYDESQKVGRAYGATVTPEFFVLDKARVVYMGAMDDGNRARRSRRSTWRTRLRPC